MWKRIMLSSLAMAVLVLAVPMQALAKETQTEKSQETDKPHFDTWQTIKRLEIVRMN